jgi:hypothetical protein
VVNLFMFFEPLAGRRTVMVRKRRTKIDWAYCMGRLLEKHYPDAEKVILVMDDLNTHGLSSFYEAFPPEEACRLAQRLEIHEVIRGCPARKRGEESCGLTGLKGRSILAEK